MINRYSYLFIIFDFEESNALAHRYFLVTVIMNAISPVPPYSQCLISMCDYSKVIITHSIKHAHLFENI